MDVRETGRRVRIARVMRGMRQEELAEKTGFSQAFISNLERGRVPDPKVRALLKVCQVLELDVAVLIETDRPAFHSPFRGRVGRVTPVNATA